MNFNKTKNDGDFFPHLLKSILICCIVLAGYPLFTKVKGTYCVHRHNTNCSQQ